MAKKITWRRREIRAGLTVELSAQSKEVSRVFREPIKIADAKGIDEVQQTFGHKIALARLLGATVEL